MQKDFPATAGTSVQVPVMQIGIVRVLVHHRGVVMRVRMGLADRIAGSMRMLVVLIVGMPMLVIRSVVAVLVHVVLGKMQVETDAHQRRRHE